MNSIDTISREVLRGPVTLANEPSDDALDLLAIFRLVRRRLWMIIGLTLLVTAAALPPILNLEKVYYAESRLLIQSSLIAPEQDQQNQLDISTEVERLLSRTIAERVIRQLKLDAREEFNPALRDEPMPDQLRRRIRSIFTEDTVPAETSEARRMDLIVPEFFQALSIRRNGVSPVVQIGFSSKDPTLAAKVPNALLSIYFDERNRKLRNRVEIAENYLLGRIGEQRARVTAAREAVRHFRETSGLISSESQSDGAQTVSTLSARRAAIQRERVELNATLATIDISTDAETNEALTSDALSELRGIQRTQRLNLARLQRIFGGNQPDVLAARAEIEDTRKAIEREGRRQVAALKVRREMLDIEDKAIGSEMELAQQRLSRLLLSEAELTSLLRVVEGEQSELNALEDKRRDVVAQAGLPAVEAEVLSPAIPPIYPQGRGRMIYMVGALIGAGAIAVTIACIRELLDESLRSFQQLRPSVRSRPGGMLPAVPRKYAADLPSLQPSRGHPGFETAIRGLILSLGIGRERNAGPSLVVTSALPGEGKSLIAAAIAIELARSRRGVLLVDCNPQSEVRSFSFRADGHPGLLEASGGDVSLDSIVRRDEASGIDFIPWGTQARYGLLDQLLVERILKIARDRSQTVIFDAGAVLASPEAALLSSIADRTLLLVRWGRTSRKAAEAAVRRLETMSCEDICVAVNRVKPRRHMRYGFKDFDLHPAVYRRRAQ
jgi:uncharacterized protein involved in exopolysaccharide biosynthesis/Mrp family chromosome partitioning ATPase